jgi:hypothetical protein
VQTLMVDTMADISSFHCFYSERSQGLVHAASVTASSSCCASQGTKMLKRTRDEYNADVRM